jgi:hypothetical protein
MQVKQQNGPAQGWVRMLSIRLGSAEKKESSGGSLLAMIGLGKRSRPQQTSATVTTGVRGFSEEDLKTAEPNPEELKKMDSLMVPKKQVKTFASEGGLQTQSVSYFDEKGKPMEVDQ